MIFASVGTQLPFDRMIRVIDRWAGTSNQEVFAQIGPTAYRPQHIRCKEFIGADEFAGAIKAASAVVAHAGMGSIILALELGKPILVMPRRAELNEHRNDHQIATARRFCQQGRIAVAFDEAELARKLDHLDELPRAQRIGSSADPRLIATIAAFIHRGSRQARGAEIGSPQIRQERACH